MEDLDLEELKELVKKQALLNADTNRVVHSMRRQMRLGALWSIVWWLLVFTVSALAYYFYLYPYIQQIQGFYQGAGNLQQSAQDFFSQYFGTSTGR